MQNLNILNLNALLHTKKCAIYIHILSISHSINFFFLIFSFFSGKKANIKKEYNGKFND